MNRPPFFGYSNFDYTWDDGAKDAVAAGETVTHSARHFNGKIRLDFDGGYVEVVNQYGEVIDEVRSDDLDDLVVDVNDRYGWA